MIGETESFGTATPVRIVIGSAGRRVYLVRWFQHAFRDLGIPGEVVVTENDVTSATFSAGDRSVHVPPYSSEEYRTVMLETVSRLRPVLFFSLNDYELDLLSRGLADDLRRMGTTVLSLPRQAHDAVADKHAMFQFFAEAGVRTPQTLLASDEESVKRLAGSHRRLVVKHRNGSGSSGLAVVTSDEVPHAIRRAAAVLPADVEHSGADPLDHVVVQPLIEGTEYGLDVVAPLRAEESGSVAVLARQKLRMRSGETDKAVSVDPGPFRQLADRIARALSAQGLIDVDVMVDASGTAHVLDVNPRFGGGYPFSHLAGADVPKMYVASALGLETDPDWLRSRTGMTSAKYEEARVTHGEGQTSGTTP